MSWRKYLRGAAVVTMAVTLVGVLALPALADIKLANLTISPTSTTAGTATAFTLTFQSNDGSANTTPDPDQKPLCLVFNAPGFGSFTAMSLSASPVAANGWTGSAGPGANQFKLVGGDAIAGKDTVTVHVTATAPAAGTFTWSVVAYGDTGCTQFPSHTLTATTAINVTAAPTPVADLSIVKTGSPNPVTSGSNLTYTLTVTNNGPATSSSATVTDTLPGGVSFVSASAGCSGTTTVTCTVGSLGPAGTVVFTIVVKVNAAPGTVISNTATVAGSSSQTDTTTSNNTSTVTTTTGSPPAGPAGNFQPDELIALASHRLFKGNDIYNGTGGRQTARADAHHGKSKTALVKIQNDGNQVDTIFLTAQGHRPGYSVKYYHGNTNISARIVNRVYSFHLNPGATRLIRVVVTVLSRARDNLVRSWQVEARSASDPAKRDVVKFKVGVLPH